MNKKNNQSLYIYIYNSIEDEWDFISSFKKKAQTKLIHESNRFADCYLFANSFLSSFTLVSPISINPDMVTYFESLTRSHARVLVPNQKTPFTCVNLSSDKILFSSLVREAKRAGSLVMYVYAMTQQVFDLKSKFEKAGVTVILPEGMVKENLWTVKYFGSKSGFRKSFYSYMPEGKIITDPSTIVSSAIDFFIESKDGIVLKTDKGNAGYGIHILKKRNFKTKTQLIHKLKTIIRKEPYLLKHPIVLEAYISTRKEKKCPFPSIEYFIHQNGRIEIPYYCNMIVTPSGEFYGMEMHESVFTKKLKEKVFLMTMTIAKTYRAAGYRGRFDIDMIYDGEYVYAGESNTRINGGTDTYLIVKKLVGKDVFSKRYVLSSYLSLPPKSVVSFADILTVLAPYLFDKKSKIGLIINSESVIKSGGLTYILVGKNKRQTHLLRHQVHTTLKKIHSS